MLILLFMLMGAYYFIRRLKMKALSSEQFPNLSADVFENWKKLEIQSIDFFLMATWGVGAAGFIMGFIAGQLSIDSKVVLPSIIIVAFIVLLVTSSIIGSRAANIRREHNLTLPKVF